MTAPSCFARRAASSSGWLAPAQCQCQRLSNGIGGCALQLTELQLAKLALFFHAPRLELERQTCALRADAT